ncbi:MAG: NAD(P)-binding domain-containing protein [Gammaproteobacteria bacterium]|nr:NAD(P)-binding domain-containing protein [Gammaproteobacteria bacterium]
MRYLGPDDLREALPMSAAIDAMREAFRGDRETPQRVLLGSSLFMAGKLGDHTGIKVVSITPGDPAGIVVVFDRQGHPIGLVDGPTLTAIRTGAAAGLATRLLAKPDASTLAMLGTGAMARDLIEAVIAVRPITKILIWSRSRDKAERLARQVGGEAVQDTNEAVGLADVVTTATPAHVPLFRDSSLSETVHINAIGAFTPEMVEIPAKTVERAFVAVDDIAAAAEEAGDLIQARRSPDATIGDLLTHTVKASSPVTLFKSVGVASQDIAAATRALATAAREGLGTLLESRTTHHRVVP